MPIVEVTDRTAEPPTGPAARTARRTQARRTQVRDPMVRPANPDRRAASAGQATDAATDAAMDAVTGHPQIDGTPIHATTVLMALGPAHLVRVALVRVALVRVALVRVALGREVSHQPGGLATVSVRRRAALPQDPAAAASALAPDVYRTASGTNHAIDSNTTAHALVPRRSLGCAK
jgi:hypothetical protein